MIQSKSQRVVSFSSKQTPHLLNAEIKPVELELSFLNITPGAMSVAQENYQSSRPALRSLNVTEEILHLVKAQQIKNQIGAMFDPIPRQERSKMVYLADLRR